MERSVRWSLGSTDLQIDRACDQFERDWQEGRNPRVEDALAGMAPDVRRTALRELLAMELELRRRRGDTLDRAEYDRRFPDNPSVVAGFAAIFGAVLGDQTVAQTSEEIQPGSATTTVRYGDLRPFRRGGLGVLFRARDESLHREAVVKFMNDECQADPSLVAQFKVEAEITSRLDHPGIVPVYGVGEDWRGRPFYVMRLVHGRELREAIQEHHALSDPDGAAARQSLFAMLEHLIAACNTIAYAHHVGIVHCDIKPSNVMIGKYGETFVLDWGLATNFERTGTFLKPNEATMRPRSATGSTAEGKRGGTYGYISPEQLAGDGPVGPASDVYSLGASLYEILIGRAPFNGRDPDVRDRILLGQFIKPRTERPRLCTRLEAICLKAMSKSPQHRYPTAKHLAEDIARWIRDEEITAAPDNWLDRIARFGRRHRGVTAALFTSLLAIVVAVAWTDSSIKTASHERERRANAEELQRVREETWKSETTSLTAALDTLEGLCRPFANGEMGAIGLIRPVVERVKEYSATYLEQFSHREGMKLHTARVLELRSVVRVSSGEVTAAIDDLLAAEGIYSKPLAEPETAADRLVRENRLARNRLNQGRLFLQLEKYDDAKRTFDAAAEHLERHVKDASNAVDLSRDLAEAYHGQAEVWLYRPVEGAARVRALEESEARFTKSREIHERLVETTTGDERRDMTRGLARNHGYLGDVYLARGDIAKARTSYDLSKKLRENLYRARPDDPESRFQFARGLNNFARLEHGYGGDWRVAIETFEKAQEIQRKLTEDFPEATSFWMDYGGTCLATAEARIFAAVEDPADADRYREQAKSAAAQAEEVYGKLTRQRHPGGPPGLAETLVLQSQLTRIAGDVEAADRLANDALRLVRDIGPEQTLSSREWVTIALAQAGLKRPKEALAAAQAAYGRGENEFVRFERLSRSGLDAVIADPATGPEFQALLEKMRHGEGAP